MMNYSWVIDAFSTFQHVEVGVSLPISAVIAAIGNAMRPSMVADETASLGFWHRMEGWYQTLSEVSVAILCLFVLFRLQCILQPSSMILVLTTAAYALPKLPPTELLYDFVLTHSLWTTALTLFTYGFTGETLQQKILFNLPIILPLLYPLKSIVYLDIAIKRYKLSLLLLHTGLFHLCILSPYLYYLRYVNSQTGSVDVSELELRLLNPPEFLETALSGVLPEFVANMILKDFTVLFIPVTFVLAAFSRGVWWQVHNIVTRRLIKKRQEMEANEQIPGITGPDMGSVKKSKKI